MNSLFAKHLLPLVVFLLFLTFYAVANETNSAMKQNIIGKEKQILIEKVEIGRLTVVEQNAFDFLFDVDKNKELLKSEDYRALLAQSLVHQGKIKELVVVDSYIFKEIGVFEYLLKTLEQSSELAEELSDNNQKYFYSCLIDASIASLKSSIEDQQKWYASAYKQYLLIDESTATFKEAELIGLASGAQALYLSQNNLEAEEIFSQGIARINESKVGEDAYYLLYKYIHFLVETKAYDKIDKWLNYTLSLAKTENNAYYKTLAYYHLVLLKAKQGLPDVSGQYLRDYQLSKVQLNAKELVRIAFVESNYYDYGNTTSVKQDKGIMAFSGLAILIIGAVVGTSVYLQSYGKRTELPIEHDVESNRLIGWSVVPQSDFESTHYDVVDNGALIEESIIELKAVPVEDISDLKKMAENNDPLFMKKFKQFFRDFAECVGKKAETPLNLAELEVCAYIKLGDTTKEVAYYRGDSIRSVENRKYRIRRKLNLPRDVDFTDWVLTA